MSKDSKKLFHLHGEDSLGNKKTLICRLTDGCISYIHYGGWGSSGMGFALSNIQYYDRVNGQISWVRNRSLPIENLEGETLEQFKIRAIEIVKNSTFNYKKEVNTKVSFS